MTGLPVGRCRNCGAALSYFARSCPACSAPNLPNPVAIAAALLAVVLAGGLIALGSLAFRGQEATQNAPHADGTPSGTASDEAPNYGWIVQAMAECEEEAKRQTDTLHFLIVPVTPTGAAVAGWSTDPIGDVGDAAVLLNSTDTMIGLRNRVFVLYQKPLAFAVSDPSTNTVFKWKPAVGVTAIKARETGAGTFKLGFEIPDLAKEIQWGPTINLSKGTCYWINPLVRAGGGSQ